MHAQPLPISHSSVQQPAHAVKLLLVNDQHEQAAAGKPQAVDDTDGHIAAHTLAAQTHARLRNVSVSKILLQPNSSKTLVGW